MTDLPMPAWFDRDRHLLTGQGAMERATGLWLAADGLPLSPHPRAHRLALEGAQTDPLGLAPDELIALAAQTVAQPFETPEE